MFGRASAPHSGQVGSGGTARMVAASTSTATSSAGQTGCPQSTVHCRKWIEPWHSATSGSPAAWKWPSTLEVNTRVGRSAAQRASTPNPECGTVDRYSASRWP
jgi:hypothetical protein